MKQSSNRTTTNTGKPTVVVEDFGNPLPELMKYPETSRAPRSTEHIRNSLEKHSLDLGSSTGQEL
jgi:hypothetical protein